MVFGSITELPGEMGTGFSIRNLASTQDPEKAAYQDGVQFTGVLPITSKDCLTVRNEFV